MTLGGPDARYQVPLPESGEAKLAILDTYTKEHSAEYQAQALIDLARRLHNEYPALGEALNPELVEGIVIHTSHHEKGQIYMPGVNFAVWAACIALVLAFKSSDALAAAYGVAVSGTMLTTSVVFAYVMRSRWNWSLLVVIPLTLVFIGVDAAFLGANLK